MAHTASHSPISPSLDLGLSLKTDKPWNKKKPISETKNLYSMQNQVAGHGGKL